MYRIYTRLQTNYDTSEYNTQGTNQYGNTKIIHDVNDRRVQDNKNTIKIYYW